MKDLRNIKRELQIFPSLRDDILLYGNQINDDKINQINLMYSMIY